MKLKIFCIYDEKAKAYAQPFYMSNDGQALRAFGDLVNDKNSQLNKHPIDYSIWKMGEYDDNSGMFECEKPEFLAKAIDYLEVKA